jgi:hypothetical protein
MICFFETIVNFDLNIRAFEKNPTSKSLRPTQAAKANNFIFGGGREGGG